MCPPAPSPTPNLGRPPVRTPARRYPGLSILGPLMASPCPHCGSTDGSDHLCSASQMALIGQVLDGRYKIEDVLGQGGMGMVFSATQTSVQRPVAVKTLNP